MTMRRCARRWRRRWNWPSYDPVTAGSFVAAKDHIRTDFPGVIVSDIRMPGRDGFHLLNYAHDIDPDLPVILLTGEGDIPWRCRPWGKGAFDFLEKPCAAADLLEVLGKAFARADTGSGAARAETRAGTRRPCGAVAVWPVPAGRSPARTACPVRRANRGRGSGHRARRQRHLKGGRGCSPDVASGAGSVCQKAVFGPDGG